MENCAKGINGLSRRASDEQRGKNNVLQELLLVLGRRHRLYIRYGLAPRYSVTQHDEV